MYSSQQLDNERPELTEYATDPADASYIAAPTASEIQTGVSPLDVLPAQWWNFYTNQMTKMNNTFLKYLKNCMDAISAVVTADGTSDVTQLKKYLDDQFAAVNGDIQALLTSSTPTAVAATASVGTSTEAARADHVHNYTFSATAPVRDNTTTAGVVGSSTLPARSDHRHPLVVDATVPAAVNATAAVGTATTYARRDHVHNYTFSTTAPAAVKATAAVGTSTLPARSDHVHNYTFSTIAPAALATSAAVGTSTLPARSDHRHPLPVKTLSSSESDSARLAGNLYVNTTSGAFITNGMNVYREGASLFGYSVHAFNSAWLSTQTAANRAAKQIDESSSYGAVPSDRHCSSIKLSFAVSNIAPQPTITLKDGTATRLVLPGGVPITGGMCDTLTRVCTLTYDALYDAYVVTDSTKWLPGKCLRLTGSYIYTWFNDTWGSSDWCPCVGDLTFNGHRIVAVRWRSARKDLLVVSLPMPTSEGTGIQATYTAQLFESASEMPSDMSIIVMLP